MSEPNSQIIDNILQVTPLMVSVSFGLVALFLKPKKSLADILLTVFIFMLAIIQLEFFLVYVGEKKVALRLLILFVPIFQSLPIVQYLYIKSLSSLTPLSKNVWKHFIPSAISCFILLIINIFFNSFIEHDAYWLMLAILILGGALVLNVIYIPKSIIIYRKHKKAAAELFSYNKGVDLKWMRLAIAGYLYFFMTLAFIEIVNFRGDVLYLTFVYVFYLFYLMINGFRQKPIANVLNRTPDYKPFIFNLPRKDIESQIKIEEDEIHTEQKYKGSSLKDDDRIEQIALMLTKYLETKKSYLDSGLNLMDISRELGINYKYISQAINHSFGKNFISLIAEYRVAEAKQMILDPNNDHLTIEAIGELCGFQSKSTFYSAFKKVTGMTPFRYKEVSV